MPTDGVMFVILFILSGGLIKSVVHIVFKNKKVPVKITGTWVSISKNQLFAFFLASISARAAFLESLILP